MSQEIVHTQNNATNLRTLILTRNITAFGILVALILLFSIILSGCGVIPMVNGIVPAVMATETSRPFISGPEAARDVALKFIQANYGQVTSATISEWIAGEVLSGELIGGTIYQYSAGDWTAKVIYPLVPPDETYYTVRIEGGAYGFVWEGLVDPAGEVATMAFFIQEATPTSVVTSTTITPIATPTPFPATISPTDVQPTPTRKPYCDWLAFVKDVTIPDGTTLKPGETFVKTWRLKNRGTCTWTPDYALLFSNGAQMGDSVSVKLSGHIGPGNTVDASVALTAPSTPGQYRGYWMLRNDSGTLFGYGENANKAFYVDIRVASSSTGTVSGKICFPSEQIPPLNQYFSNMTQNKRIEFSTHENQSTYQVQLEPGEYLTYAWTKNFELAGGFTDSEHRLKSFEVKAGHTLTGIDICDWYGDPGTIPLPSPDHYGTISGKLSFPSEHIPPLRVVAFDMYHNAYHWVDTVANQQTYEIKNLLPGYYTVVAYVKEGDFAGGYTEFAKCGLGPECTEDHTLVTIYIAPGDHIINANPADWYAPMDTFPPDPTR